MSAGTTVARQTFAYWNMQIIHTCLLQMTLVIAAAAAVDGYIIIRMLVL